MTKPTTINMTGIGPVLFERSPRARRINIAVRPFKGVRVGVPKGVSFKNAARMVHNILPWIQEQQIKIKRLEQSRLAFEEQAGLLDRQEAKKDLTNRLHELATKHGFSFNRVFVRNQKTRWGSCSGQNNINLNIKLLLLDQELRDFIILHELVHTRVKNHGKEFWRQLLAVEPNAMDLDARMKKIEWQA